MNDAPEKDSHDDKRERETGLNSTQDSQPMQDQQKSSLAEPRFSGTRDSNGEIEDIKTQVQ